MGESSGGRRGSVPEQNSRLEVFTNERSRERRASLTGGGGGMPLGRSNRRFSLSYDPSTPTSASEHAHILTNYQGRRASSSAVLDVEKTRIKTMGSSRSNCTTSSQLSAASELDQIQRGNPAGTNSANPSRRGSFQSELRSSTTSQETRIHTDASVASTSRRKSMSELSLPNPEVKAASRAQGTCVRYKARVKILDSTCVCGKPKRDPVHTREIQCAACGEKFMALENKKTSCKRHTGKPIPIPDKKDGQKTLFAWTCCPKEHAYATSISTFMNQSLPHGRHI
eukprot:3521835-Rhodomonas_salina.1